MPNIKLSVAEPQDQVSPLVRFKGTLKEYKIMNVEATDDRKASVYVLFNFTDVVVIESTEPYPFPIATIRLPYSERANTRWSVFTKSFRDLVPPAMYEGGEQPFDCLVGKELEMHFGPCKMRTPDENNVWAVRESRSWQLVGVAGLGNAGAGSITDAIVNRADGLKDADIYQWVYTDQGLKNYSGYMETVEAVASRTLLTTLVAAGKLTQDSNGVYHKA